MKLEILNYGHPMLRKKRRPISDITEATRQLARDMLDTMYDAVGVGLAAQQVGRTEALCVVDIPPGLDVVEEDGPPQNPDVPMPLILMNPEILESEGSIKGTEGCLSFPEIHLEIKRSETIRLAYTDLAGARCTIEVRGFLARAIQHEIDHLDGILFIDHVSEVRRLGMGGQLKRIKKETLEKTKEGRVQENGGLNRSA